MMIELPKNGPSRLSAVRVNKIQFNHIFTDSAVAMGEKIARDLAALKDDIAPVADKRFVLFKNKKVWFDREVSGLFPRMEDRDLPVFQCNSSFDNRAIKNFKCFEREGFKFSFLTFQEVEKTFGKGKGNPYLDGSGNLTFCKNVSHRSNIIVGIKEGSDCSYWYDASNNCRRGNECGNCPGNCTYTATLVPIYRLRGKNAAAMSYFDSFFSWIKLGLMPEGLKARQEKFFSDLINDYPTLEEYITVEDETITFDSAHFSADVLSGAFTETVFGYDFDIKGTLNAVLDGSKQYSGSVGALKTELLNCDHKRANIQPYDERILTDINRGHWDLFEPAREGDIEIDLPQDEMLVARPPQMDVRLHGLCAIDFGTKSTIVVCRDGDARMLRIGKGDYSKAPTMKDFENPTAIELRDINSFLDAYRARVGRPFTEWDQVTVSHQAAEAIFKADVGSSVYNSVFNELKQWAKDEQSYPILKDLSGVTQDIKPYLETQSIDGGDFDPIELYAYYLGLYINNMHHKIYLDYILSYPVNYRKDVREHIRASFERGLRKSLPPALQADEQMMKHFRVYLGASEPAAYAISALECFGLEPKRIGDKIAYGVFDFGGGTTDFDFGIEYIPENKRRNFVIDQFGFNGDILLGGENILELLAYEVYKDNIDIMRKNKIPFALPPGCELFAGAETLVSRTKDASSHMNNRILAEKLRPIWEHTDEIKSFGEDAMPVTLFSRAKNNDSYTLGVKLNVDVKRLEKRIEERIRVGVENFFQSMYSAFEGKAVYPIHIFLAGNSCRSAVVKTLFDEFIKQEEGKLAENIKADSGQDKDTSGTFILHQPLGMGDEASALDPSMLDRQRTGKTGVAFGLLRCRKGGKDIKINNKNVDRDDEVKFQYFLGDAGADGQTFTVRIGREVKYGEWAYFTSADEADFEIYYTTTPRALKNNLPIEQVSMVRCVLDDEDVSEDDDAGVYVRKVDPNTIEYAAGSEDDFKGEFKGKIYRQKLSQV